MSSYHNNIREMSTIIWNSPEPSLSDRLLGRGLTGVYTQAWQALAVAVSGDEAGAAMLTTIANNTLAVLGPVPERRSEWRSALVGLRNQATATGDRPLAAFVDAVLALGESVPDDEIREQVVQAIAQSNAAGALQDHATQAMIGRLFRRLDLLQYAVADGQADIAERLATQAAHYQALFVELRVTVERIDATTARTDETAARIDANVRALLDRVQPPTDPAQQLAGALALLATLPLDELPAIAPLPPGSRPVFSPNPLFVGRAGDLRALAKILQAGATAAVGQVAAATGLGGIGKTQLAVEFAHRYGRFFAGGVFWLSCRDPNAVATEVVACGLLMGLPAFEALDFPDQARRVQQAWQEPIPRLLIFDNCEEEEVLAQWRPATGGCRVLVTSRRATWSAGLGVQQLPLPTLPRGESIALLRRFRPDLAAGDTVLNSIADELGDLPLALHLAGNFLKRYQHDVTPAAYLLELRRPDLLAHRSMVTGDRSPTAHENHVARTFAISYDRLDRNDPVDALALVLLSGLACFAPGEPVARDLLLLAVGREQKGPDFESSDTLRRLAELGLVGPQEDGSHVMHRLLAAFVLALPGIAGTQTAVEDALNREAGRLNKTGFPVHLLSWQGHLRHIADQALQRGDLQAAWLCNQLGYHLKQAGDLPAARPYLEQALAIRRQALGETHPDTATSLNNLGALLKAMGDLPAARLYYEQALALLRTGVGHPPPGSGRGPPRHRHQPQQLRPAAPSHGRLLRRSALLGTGACRPPPEPGRGPPRHRPEPQQPRSAAQSHGRPAGGPPLLRAGVGRPPRSSGRYPSRHRHQPEQLRSAAQIHGRSTRRPALLRAGVGHPQPGPGRGPPLHSYQPQQLRSSARRHGRSARSEGLPGAGSDDPRTQPGP